MSKITRSINKVEALIGDLDNGIEVATEKNSKLTLSVQNLLILATKIIETIDGWFAAAEARKEAQIELNKVEIEKGEKLRSNLKGLFE
jgi:hypothetical protein